MNISFKEAPPFDINALTRARGDGIGDIFDQAIHSLMESPIKRVATGATIAHALTRAGIQAYDLPSGWRMTPMTQFILYPESGFGYKADTRRPTVLVDKYTMLTGSSEQIQSDILRTSQITSTYPDRGFQGRLRDIYNRALRTQAAWLNFNDIGPVENDPRVVDRETLLKRILGNDRLEGDAGFKDWQSGIDLWDDMFAKASEPDWNEIFGFPYPYEGRGTLCRELDDARAINGKTNSDLRNFLAEARNDIPNFLCVRENETSKVVEIVREIPAFQALGRDKRAKTMGLLLVQASLLDHLASRRRPLAA